MRLVGAIVFLFFLQGLASQETFQSLMGCQTDIPPRPSIASMHRAIRQKFAGHFQSSAGSNAVVYLNSGRGSGGRSPFRQDSNFLYLTGEPYPDYDFAMDMSNRESHLFLPVRSEHYLMWEGKEEKPEEVKQLYGVDHVHWKNQTATVMNSITSNKQKTVYMLSWGTFPGSNQYNLNKNSLNGILSTSRRVKTNDEIEMLRITGMVSTDAHINILKDTNPDLWEYNIDALMKYYCASCSMIHQAYPPIVAAGYHGAILHYQKNDEKLQAKDLILLDAGAEYFGYSIDITRTFPADGKFSSEQKAVYDIVYDALIKCEALVKPGAQWGTISSLAIDTISQGLLKIGVLKGSLAGIKSSRAYSVFYFHGLGHNIGLDVHDPGSLGRLEENMALTVEPGIYFNEVAVRRGFNNNQQRQYLNEEVINKYLAMDFGGIRIEDSIRVTASGFENLTPVPKSVADVEAVMNQ